MFDDILGVATHKKDQQGKCMEQAQKPTPKAGTLSVMATDKADIAEAKASFSDLYRQHASRVYYYLYARVRSVAEAEDLTSQTFITALENYYKLKDPAKFVPWVFSIARNKANDHYRERYRHPVERFDEDLQVNHELSSSTLQMERMIELERLISALKPVEQEYLRLRLVADLPFAQIADILKQPENRIKKSYYRLLERLQAQVE